MYPSIPKNPNDQLKRVWDALIEAGCKYDSGQDWSCPAHDDDRASLGVTQGDSQPVLLKCLAGCTVPEILEALDLTPSDISGRAKKVVESTTTWTYTDEVGHPLIDVHRLNYSDGSKSYRQARSGQAASSVTGIRNTLYNLPAVITAVRNGGEIWVVEGEKSADALIELGECATTQRMGASQPWPDDFTDLLVGAGSVRVVADFDSAGFKRALAVGRALHAKKIPVSLWHGAVLRKGADVVDHICNLQSRDQLVRMSSVECKAWIAKWERGDDEDSDETPDHVNIWPNGNTPLAVAHRYLELFHTLADVRTLVYWRQSFYSWSATANHYLPLEEMQLIKHLQRQLDDAVVSTDLGFKPWNVTPAKIKNVVWTLMHEVAVSDDLDRCYLDGTKAPNLVSFANGNYDLVTKKLHEPTPQFFTTFASPFNFERKAEPPKRWLEILHTYWKNDQDSIDALQEWFGYVISGRTNLHTIFLLTGPPRSGKSTISNILQALVGEANCCGPTFQSISGSFGLATWIGKSLAVVSDATFSSKDNASHVVTTLKSVSGEDFVETNRKNKDALNIRLGTRIMIVSNEFPIIPDPSGALARRYLAIRTTVGFTNMEDRTLTEYLLTHEMPGIMAWALEGLERVIEREHFTTVRSMAHEIKEREEATSEVKEFMRDRCKPSKGWIYKADLYEAFCDWRQSLGFNWNPTHHRFSNELKSAYPSIGTTQKNRKWCWVGVELRNRVNRVTPLRSSAGS